ncbi:transcriptional regulator domain-containing protein [Pandoraea communis]|uniref:Transcriptional regulator-like domain-containing protein n=1 Tax=Pandoraea communis TaxID=2508297 RepID=A0A5E4Z342_9BURK|nr:hypothetical protein [Pandoraea communis]MDM8359222.1 hypothetical protein [Pandoraea communis]VVE55108.1 hypothetical protein PCO31111_05014 [Pandoraea communis]
MTNGSDAAERVLRFVRRADWKDEDLYPNDDMLDATAWAWELLRRSREYDEDFAKWGKAFADVPAKPRDDMPVSSYVCDPPPLTADSSYLAYSQAFPEHTVVSVKDFIRLRWGLLALPDPSMTWDEVFRANKDRSLNAHARLAWMFSGNAIEVIREPAADISKANRPTFVTVACGADEVVVRLMIGGDPQEYGRALTRELEKFFVGGSRHGARRTLTYGEVKTIPHPETGEPVQGIFLDPDGGRWSDSPVIEIQESRWSELGVKRASLLRILRMGDLLADFERGELVLSQQKRGRVLQVSVHPDVSVAELGHALHKHIDQGQFFKEKDKNLSDVRDVRKWLDDANEFICNKRYLRLSRTRFEEESEVPRSA